MSSFNLTGALGCPHPLYTRGHLLMDFRLPERRIARQNGEHDSHHLGMTKVFFSLQQEHAEKWASQHMGRQ